MLLESNTVRSDSGGEARLPLLRNLLPRVIRSGRLTVIDAAGRQACFGDSSGEPSVSIRLHEPGLPIRLAVNPVLATGEAYMDGRLTVEEGELRDLVLMASADADALYTGTFSRLFRKLSLLTNWIVQANSRSRSRRNVEHHYDLPSELYDLFLDSDRVYSCAYFKNGDETLSEAQQAKLRHIIAKLLLRPGQRVLDIGSGWGTLATLISKEADCHVKGLTLSPTQLAESRARALESGLGDRVDFQLRDYRDETGRFDRIVSVGMLEHVGRRRLDRYFGKVAELLEEDGVALIHSIGRADTLSTQNNWINRYIFPGGYIPALSEVAAAAERAGLWITDVEILRLHYAETLRCWADRFRANRDAAVKLQGERFCRMWEYYLATCEAAFRNGRLMVFQIQLARRNDTVPLTRDYIREAEQRMTGGDGG